MCARQVFYIFSRSADRAQFCAVRQDQPIPRFLDGTTWRFVRTLDASGAGPAGFDRDAADGATGRAGVYFYRGELARDVGWRSLAAA